MRLLCPVPATLQSRCSLLPLLVNLPLNGLEELHHGISLHIDAISDRCTTWSAAQNMFLPFISYSQAASGLGSSARLASDEELYSSGWTIEKFCQSQGKCTNSTSEQAKQATSIHQPERQELRKHSQLH